MSRTVPILHILFLLAFALQGRYYFYFTKEVLIIKAQRGQLFKDSHSK